MSVANFLEEFTTGRWQHFEFVDANHRGGGRGVYFRDPNSHILELLTVE
ncbi:MAG TPA: hypothetical protein VHK27_11830 [Gammaproteobacteria bacterium]|nr:hypothetical protein [Gammaproteobacteria bacterium]